MLLYDIIAQWVFAGVTGHRMGTNASIEIGQDADNADQKVKWFMKVHKTYRLCGKHIYNHLFSKFLFRFTSCIFFDSPPSLKRELNTEID